MGSNYTDKVIISVGGSLVVPQEGVDTQFLKQLNVFIRSQLALQKNRQFFLVVGGGATLNIDGAVLCEGDTIL